MAAGADHRQAGYPDSMASKGIRLFWKWESRPGRPRIPQELRQLIAHMVHNNPSWGEERIASELLLKIEFRFLRAQWGDTCLISRGESSRPRTG
jgi:hypothetical protein